MKNRIITVFAIVSLLSFIPSYALAATDCTGGTITYSGGNTIHTFTSSGTLDCTNAGGGLVKALVVGGGGAGGGSLTTQTAGGGGGGGGYLYDATHVISARSYSITVGTGATGVGASGTAAQSGLDSVFSDGVNTMTAIGGGGGGTYNQIGGSNNGGSGGGGGTFASGMAGGTGVSGQGNNGGSGEAYTDSDVGGGGGGGSSGAGTNGASGVGGNGGAGTTNSITGSSVTYGSGGGGGGNVTAGSASSGGGSGGQGASAQGLNGTDGTGGGGGGSSNITTEPNNVGGDGGDGIVVISYPTGSLLPQITGFGTTNRLAKFATSTIVTDALLSDNGTDTTLTSGNFLMQINSIIDSVTTGAFNFGTISATTLTFGRSGQNMIINSKLGISTSSPVASLAVNGDIFSNVVKLLENGAGLDTYSPGLLAIGSTTATSITIGRTNATTTISGPLKVTNLNSVSNCSSSATPAVCGSAPAGSVAMPTGGSTLVVNTTAVTANSQIFVFEDSSLGTRLGITCNTTTGRVYSINARAVGVSFTIKSSANPAANKACLSYLIVN